MSNAHNGAMLSPEASQIETASGRFVDVLNPDPATIDLGDIAHHLALTCRYGGAVKRFYSVAEHVVLVHDLLEERGASEGILRTALLHDAAEAYLGDVVAPLKWALRKEQWRGDNHTMSPFGGYRGAYTLLSERMDAAIADRFLDDLDRRVLTLPDVGVADMWALRIEALELTETGGANWRWPGELPNRGEKPARVQWVGGLQPGRAEALLLARFAESGLLARQTAKPDRAER